MNNPSSRSASENEDGDSKTGIPQIIEQFIDEQADRDQTKDKFLNPRFSYSGEFTPANLILDANLQEFAHRTSIVCALENGGKITPREAYDQIKMLWAELSHSKHMIFGDD
jgi:hypothetical protein